MLLHESAFTYEGADQINLAVSRLWKLRTSFGNVLIGLVNLDGDFGIDLGERRGLQCRRQMGVVSARRCRSGFDESEFTAQVYITVSAKSLSCQSLPVR
jgi:hypothetical protein